MTDAPKTTTRPRAACPCGTTREDPRSVVEREYTFLGTIYLLWGGTAIPIEVKFRCTKCNRVFDRSDAPGVCRRYVL